MSRRGGVLVAVAIAAAGVLGCGQTGAIESPAQTTPAAPAPDSVALAATDGGATVVTFANGQTRTLDGSFDHARLAPGIAPDGRALQTGLLVLADRANEASTTEGRFALVDPTLAREPQVVSLPGDFDYDAVAPDGSKLFLAEYVNADTPKGYEVRFYDIAAGRLDPRVVVDKTGASETMAGTPIARVSRVDGTWVYTLYRGTEHPFIHALEAVEGYSICIDLPHETMAITDWEITLAPDERTLEAVGAALQTRAVIDLETFAVTMV